MILFPDENEHLQTVSRVFDKVFAAGERTEEEKRQREKEIAQREREFDAHFSVPHPKHCCHPDVCGKTGRCERRVRGELHSCVD